MQQSQSQQQVLAQNRPQSAVSQRKSGQKVALPEPQQDQDLEEYIDILVEHQKNCEKSGKYVEAEMAKRRLQELRKELEKRNKEDMKCRHLTEKQEIEKAHLAEFNEFNEYWDKKMQEFDDEAMRVEKETIQKHQEELQRFAEELERSIPLKPKDNVALLNLKKMEESLAKQEEYIEAHKVQQQVLKIEKDEYEKWIHQRNQKIRNLITQLHQRQANELAALRQRIISGQEEQRKIRSQELEKLLQKYQNVRKELESSQNQENSRLDKTIRQGSIMNVSKMMNSSRMTNQSLMQGSKKI